jgi:hypothetical protein
MCSTTRTTRQAAWSVTCSAGPRAVDRTPNPAVLTGAFPSLTPQQLHLALSGCGEVASIDDLLQVSSGAFFDVVAQSIIGGAPSLPLADSLPGLRALTDSPIAEGTFSARPHNVLRRLRHDGPYTWADIAARSPNQLLTLTNLGLRSATEIVRVAARASLAMFADVSIDDAPTEATRSDTQVAVIAILPLSLRRALITVAAWLDIATDVQTLGPGLLQVADGPNRLPDDVAGAWSIIRDTPLRDLAGRAMLSLSEQLEELDTALGDERARTVFWARINIDPPTLDSLAAPMDLTRERVRQVQVKAEDAARLALLRPELAALRWQAGVLRETLGAGFPESASWARSVLEDFAQRGGDEWGARLRALLLWLAGPYRRDDEAWLVRATLPTRESVRAAIDDSQRVEIEKVEALLADAGLARAAVDDWLARYLPVRRIGEDAYVWDGSVADKACAVLNAWGRPATADELSDAIGEGHALRSTRTRLLDDPRFQRVDRVRIGLRSWPHDEYTGIVDELAQELESRGGESDIRDLVMTVAHNYDLKIGSVEAYTAAPRFVVEGARIRLRGADEPYQPRRSLTDEARCYLVSDVECTYRMTVDRDVLRGSGRPIPEGLGSWLGVLPRGRRDFAFGDDVVPVTWPDSALMGPSIGSVRRSVASLGASDGDQLLLQFNREHSTGTATLVTSAELTADRPEVRVAALTGIPVNGSIVEVVARAVGAPPPSVKERLRKRGEHDLLEIVSSAGLHLDAALDRLREVL